MQARKISLGALTLTTALSLTFAAWAADTSKYPDLSGQWVKPGRYGNQWDPTKPPGRGQQAPLTPEYQKVLQASLADQAAGGQGGDTRITCRPNGMPRMMTPVRPLEFIVEPNTAYVLSENNMPRRIYTDGRAFPTDEDPTYAGYSVGKWIDTNGDGRFDTLEVETRNFKGPRTYEASGHSARPGQSIRGQGADFPRQVQQGPAPRRHHGGGPRPHEAVDRGQDLWS
jgi:hypothetical protein